MRLRLRPREDSFYEFFVRAATNLVESTSLLAELKLPEADYSRVSSRMAELEHTNDEVTHALFRKLNKSFITPFDRGDVYRLGSSLDDVLDHMESAANLVYLYGVSGLPPLPKEMHAQIDVIGECANQIAQAMPRLKELKNLDRYYIEVNRLENEGDTAYRALLAHVFGGEYDALTVLKLKEIGDELEETVDAFEQVANVVETILVKES